MSTRCCLHFCDESFSKPKVRSRIYRHYDGYESAVLPDLERFFDAVEEQTRDCRFSDPEYLAAKYVVWQANENRLNKNAPPCKLLDFTGVGVCMEDAGDIEYRYRVLCYNDNRPKVEWEKVHS